MKFFYSADEHNNAPVTFTNVRASRKAEVFSEAYFCSLYSRKLRSHLKRMWKFSTEAFELEWPAEFTRPPEEFETAADYEAARAEYLENRKEALDDWQPEPWDEAAKRADFERDYQWELQGLARNLPPEILNKVADLRVLALGMAAPDVKRDILALERKNQREEIEWLQALRTHHEQMCKKYPGSFIERLYMHDAVFAGMHWQGENLIFDMDGSGCLRETGSRVTFMNCEILQMQQDLTGSEWLYQEVHEDGGRFIVHVLTFNWNREGYSKYDELTLRASDVELE